MTITTDLIEFNWTLPMVLITFLIFVLIMKRLFFGKVQDFMNTRRDEISEAYRKADDKIAEAEGMKASYEKKLKVAREKSLSIIKEAKESADVKAQLIIKDAEEKAYNIIWQAEEQIKRDKIAAARLAQEQIGELAVIIAGKVLEKNLTFDDQTAFIGKMIEEVGDAKWQN